MAGQSTPGPFKGLLQCPAERREDGEALGDRGTLREQGNGPRGDSHLHKMPGPVMQEAGVRQDAVRLQAPPCNLCLADKQREVVQSPP